MPELSKDLQAAIAVSAEKKKRRDSYQIDMEVEERRKKREADEHFTSRRAVIVDEEDNEPEELGPASQVQKPQLQVKITPKQDVDSPRRNQVLEAITKAKKNPTEGLLAEIQNAKKLKSVSPSKKQDNKANLQVSQELHQQISDKVNAHALNLQNQEDDWDDNVAVVKQPVETRKQELPAVKKEVLVEQPVMQVAVSAEAPKVEAPQPVQVQKVVKQAETPKVVEAQPKEVSTPKAPKVEVAKQPAPKVEPVQQPKEQVSKEKVAEKIKFFENPLPYEVRKDINRIEREAEMHKLISKGGVNVAKVNLYDNYVPSHEKTNILRDERKAEMDKVIPKGGVKEKIGIYENPAAAAKQQIRELVGEDVDFSKADSATLFELASDIQTRGLEDLRRSSRTMRKTQEKIVEPSHSVAEKNEYVQENQEKSDYLLALQIQQVELCYVSVCYIQSQQAIACAAFVTVVTVTAVQLQLQSRMYDAQSNLFAHRGEKVVQHQETNHESSFRLRC